MSGGVLVAGVGNIFLGDDAFGSEVARRLANEPLPETVRVVDFGIRGVDLAYELMDGHALTILVDATARGGAPGTVYLIEPDLGEESPAMVVDAHGLTPGAVFTLVKTLGGGVTGRVLVVGCEPADVDERMGLSEPVAEAVDEAVRVVRELIDQEAQEVAR